MIDLSERERDTRVETLRAGDRVRWMGAVHDVTGVTPITGRPALVGYPLPRAEVGRVAVLTTTPTRWGGPISLVFPVGHFVAADAPRAVEPHLPAMAPAARPRDLGPRSIRPTKRTAQRRHR